MRSRTINTMIFGFLPAYYLTCCVLALAVGMASGGLDLGAVVPGLVTMVLFAWMFMLAAISGNSSLGDVREMQMVMLAAMFITPLWLWLYLRLSPE